jgi:methionine aminotransferase
LSTYIKKPENFDILPGFYQEKRDFFLNAIKGSKFRIKPSKGTYFQLLGYDKISDENDFDFAIRLTRERKIASIPISAFYNNKTDNKVLRFCFSKSEETLLRGAEILNQIGS